MTARDDVDFELREIDERILDILEEGRCTRKHLADLLEVSSEYVYQRVDLMKKLGLVNVIHDGFYELEDHGDPENVADAPTPGRTELSEKTVARGRAGVAVVDDDLRARAEDALGSLPIKGRKAALERRRREAVLWAWDYLREHEEATSRQIANATFGAHWDEDLGYSTSSRHPGYQLWDSVVRDALDELPGVDGPGQRGNQWAFVEGADE